MGEPKQHVTVAAFAVLRLDSMSDISALRVIFNARNLAILPLNERLGVSVFAVRVNAEQIALWPAENFLELAKRFENNLHNAIHDSHFNIGVNGDYFALHHLGIRIFAEHRKVLGRMMPFIDWRPDWGGRGIELDHNVPMRGLQRPRPFDPNAARLLVRAETALLSRHSTVDAVRVFENGFSEHNEAKLILKVCDFLNKGPMSYEKSELRKLFNVRGESAHAKSTVQDLKDPKFDLPIVRLLQASRDVAYNKKAWGKKLPIRQNRVQFLHWVERDGSITCANRSAMPKMRIQRAILPNWLFDRSLDTQVYRRLAQTAERFVFEELLAHASDPSELRISQRGRAREIVELTPGFLELDHFWGTSSKPPV